MLTLENHNVIPVSIKTKKINCAVEMGDLMRNATKTEDFLLTVGFWKGTEKLVVQRNFLYIPLDEWRKNFSFSLSNKMANIFKDNNITNSNDDDLRWKKLIKIYKKEWNDSDSGISVHFKRDHKNQRRVQCSIKKPYFKELTDKYSVNIKKRINF